MNKPHYITNYEKKQQKIKKSLEKVLTKEEKVGIIIGRSKRVEESRKKSLKKFLKKLDKNEKT